MSRKSGEKKQEKKQKKKKTNEASNLLKHFKKVFVDDYLREEIQGSYGLDVFEHPLINEFIEKVYEYIHDAPEGKKQFEIDMKSKEFRVSFEILDEEGKKIQTHYSGKSGKLGKSCGVKDAVEGCLKVISEWVIRNRVQFKRIFIEEFKICEGIEKERLKTKKKNDELLQIQNNGGMLMADNEVKEWTKKYKEAAVVADNGKENAYGAHSESDLSNSDNSNDSCSRIPPPKTPFVDSKNTPSSEIKFSESVKKDFVEKYFGQNRKQSDIVSNPNHSSIFSKTEENDVEMGSRGTGGSVNTNLVNFLNVQDKVGKKRSREEMIQTKNNQIDQQDCQDMEEAWE